MLHLDNYSASDLQYLYIIFPKSYLQHFFIVFNYSFAITHLFLTPPPQKQKKNKSTQKEDLNETRDRSIP